MEAAGSSHLCVEAACEFLPKVDISRHRRSTAVGSPALRPGLIEEYSWTVLKSFKKMHGQCNGLYGGDLVLASSINCTY